MLAGPAQRQAAASPPFALPANYVSAFISGSGILVPSADYMQIVLKNYVLPHFPGGSLANALALWTPAGLYPLTGTTVLTLNESVAQGVSILHDTMSATLAKAREIAENNAFGVWQTKIGLNTALDAPSLRHAIRSSTGPRCSPASPITRPKPRGRIGKIGHQSGIRCDT
ncbi:hypothetical protein B4U45_08965 [Mycobacterium persicum]|uniref:PE-PPE domain-containing protein n=1 Tax=Mycobacterium persicum TaxID=1487726 RepID=A0A8E2IW59_9MYCO|nr:hypothetical protein A4G31_07665 [Mycobacterium persicum]ORB33514.1 hypothetical protein BST40_26360 [Mycobacterium persicum]ORB94739.1 hypothetical protein B1T44_09650 [Mycobacterium persicum]ORC01487.1 hypothetical protein B1T48_09430 [Mycobacterium persicum]ORC06732.1 hypothetical protein B4U45_08965 [Mycobacterium persicum]